MGKSSNRLFGGGGTKTQFPLGEFIRANSKKVGTVQHSVCEWVTKKKRLQKTIEDQDVSR